MNEILKNINTVSVLIALGLLILGNFGSSIILKIFNKILPKSWDENQKVGLNKLIKYLINILILGFVLNIAGVDLKLLIGAAGVFSVALGFASQTSASNLISGLFIWIEKPFKIGDTIEVNGVTGIVLTIDLLSTKLRTPANLMVRIPNESLMKSQIINITHFPIRRIDLVFNISNQIDIKNVENELAKTVEHHPDCLDEPKYLFIIEKIGEYYTTIQFSFWVKRENFLKSKNLIQIEISKLFNEGIIKYPNPVRHIYHLEKNENQ